MIPPNTVPIDWQEFQQLLEAPIPVLCFNSLRQHWITVNATNWKYDKEGFEQSEFRIAAHDYRQYLGEVVDLGEKETLIEGVKWRVDYLGHTFELHKYSWECKVYTDYENQDCPLWSGTEPKCKQFVCDHFTALFKKDLPHLNIKFIWS